MTNENNKKKKEKKKEKRKEKYPVLSKQQLVILQNIF